MRIICQRDRYRYIRLPIRFTNKQFKIDHNTNFCVDTGAPYSLVTYEQAVEWNIPLDKLTPTPNPHRVGGIEGQGYYLENSVMLFRDFRGKLQPIAVNKIVVLGPPFKLPGKPIPPLLGDDVLRQFTLIVKSDQQGGDIILTNEDIQINFPAAH
jgi:hypothetical protein